MTQTDVKSGHIHKLIDETVASRLAELFALLGDANRLRILSAIACHEMSVKELADAVGMTESATSHQLRQLRSLRVVRQRKEGRQVFYCLHDSHIRDLFEFGVSHIQHD
jgi:ArsR family transcriptional regulator, lead/cadmium/zinc/bismuth-responsive transcriptional repressor